MRPSSRRRFIGQAVGGTAAVMAWPSWLQGLELADSETAPVPHHPPPLPRAPQDAVRDEAFWERVKEQFPLAPGLILMNAANLCPSPYPVQETVFRLAYLLLTDTDEAKDVTQEVFIRAFHALDRFD